MKTIIAIGGSVIKTAHEEIKEAAKRGMFDMLIHNGGSIFHDFQRTTEPLPLETHSYPLDELLEDYQLNRKASILVWNWIKTGEAPANSLTEICQGKGMSVLIFTALGCDFWQLFNSNWDLFAQKTLVDFRILCAYMRGEFHFINMGSAVIHPEVFTKALAITKPKKFIADVVDFIDMYRPKTRVARYGKYYHMTHEEFLTRKLKEGKF